MRLHLAAAGPYAAAAYVRGTLCDANKGCPRAACFWPWDAINLLRSNLNFNKTTYCYKGDIVCCDLLGVLDVAAPEPARRGADEKAKEGEGLSRKKR